MQTTNTSGGRGIIVMVEKPCIKPLGKGSKLVSSGVALGLGIVCDVGKLNASSPLHLSSNSLVLGGGLWFKTLFTGGEQKSDLLEAPLGPSSVAAPPFPTCMKRCFSEAY